MLQVIEGNIDHVSWNQNDADMTGVHLGCSGIVFKVSSKDYGRGWSVVQFEKLRIEVCVFKHKVVNMCLPACTSGLLR